MKRLIALILMMTFCVVLFTGCNSSDSKGFSPIDNGETLNIAILGSDEEFEVRKDFMAGIELAIEDLANNGVKVSYTKFNDEGNYDQGVINAKNIIKDDQYTLAITFQSEEVVSTISGLFDEAKKPLIIANTCEEDTVSKEYKYILNGLITGDQVGESLANYASQNNANYMAIAHSISNRNLSIVEGLESADSNDEKIMLVDAAATKKANDFIEVIERWKVLGVNAVVVALDDMELASNFIKVLREKAPNVLVMGDYTFNNEEYLNKYGPYLEGMILAASYPVDSAEKLQQFYDKYESRITYVDITSITAQAYDFINMIVERMAGAKSVDDFMNNMKSPDGYVGITGVEFDENGNLNKDPKYWIIKNSKVYRLENLASVS